MKFLFLTIRNRADLDEGGTPELQNVVLPLSAEQTVARLQAVVPALRGWRVEKIEGEQIHLTRTTRLCRFVDDIHLRLEVVPQGTRLHGHSQSRVGLSDLGQNRRNLLELVRALRQSAGSA